jgi:Ca2+-binding EF-hand superfamily protein
LEELIKAFAFFDEGRRISILDSNGYITESDLKKIMSSFGEPLNSEETN